MIHHKLVIRRHDLLEMRLLGLFSRPCGHWPPLGDIGRIGWLRQCDWSEVPWLHYVQTHSPLSQIYSSCQNFVLIAAMSTRPKQFNEFRGAFKIQPLANVVNQDAGGSLGHLRKVSSGYSMKPIRWRGLWNRQAARPAPALCVYSMSKPSNCINGCR